jgi:hypothetical protein
MSTVTQRQGHKRDTEAFPLFRSITIASQFARTLCLFRFFVQLASFAALRLFRLTNGSHCVTLQPATLWDHVARNVACATNWAPTVRHTTVHMACRNTAALHKQSDRRHFSFTTVNFATLCCVCPRASHFVDACNCIRPLVKNLKFLLL